MSPDTLLLDTLILFLSWRSSIPAAIDDDCHLTQPLGLNMAEFPLSPMFARMLLTSGRYIIFNPRACAEGYYSRSASLCLCMSVHKITCSLLLFHCRFMTIYGIVVNEL